jgi:uncharacterized membrane protein YfcA
MLETFSVVELSFIAMIFVWTGFVRTGIGFGGAALGLPFMLLIFNSPIYWLPIVSAHLLFFSGLTLAASLNEVDWKALKASLWWIMPSALVGVFGLINLPNQWLVIFVYSVTLFYSLIWLFDKAIESHNPVVDKILLIVGGYVTGATLTGAPLIVAVLANHVNRAQLRNTLFVLWVMLVSLKMITFLSLGVEIDWALALILFPIVAVGHVIGLKLHNKIIENERIFKRFLGVILLVISLIGLFNVLS